MKLNYREKIILGCFLAVAILLGAFLGLVKPKTKTLKNNQARLEELNDEKDEITNKINQIEPLQKKIHDIYDETVKLADIFVPSEDVDTPVELDEMLQKYADENNVLLETVQVGTPSVSNLNYYFFKTENVDSTYRDSVDLGGQLEQKYLSDHEEELALKEREVEQLFQTKYGVKIVGTKENIFNYLEAIKDYDKAMIINSVQIYDYSFGQDAIDAARNAGSQIAEAVAPQEEAPAETEEAAAEETTEAAETAETTETAEPAENAEETPQASAPTTVVVDGQEITNESECQIVISVYSVYDVPEPNTSDIPAAE